MPPPTNIMSPGTRPLHLLRALLREASYLPDAAARDYFRRYIVARFKAYQPQHHATASAALLALDRYRHRAFKRRLAAVIADRAAHQHRNARKGLNLLRRANQGEASCLQKVLWLTYGRLGRRKHALLSDLLKPDPTWPPGPAPLQQLYHSTAPWLQYFEAPNPRNASHGFHVIWVSKQFPRLRAVLTSQCQHHRALGPAIKRPYIKTPILNTWMRPMPLKRAVNNVRRWYAENMTRLLPPLPAAEWDTLHALSTGTQRIAFARRRTPATEPAHDSFEHTLHRSLALHKLSKADRPQGFARPHALTVRYMQRLYAKLLTLSCKLEYDGTWKQWSAVWGEPREKSRPKSYAAPVDQVLFDGVDATGLKPRPALEIAASKELEPPSALKTATSTLSALNKKSKPPPSAVLTTATSNPSAPSKKSKKPRLDGQHAFVATHLRDVSDKPSALSSRKRGR